MTFAELFEWVEKNEIDWNSEIYYERIEDFYFKVGTGWLENCLKIKGESYLHQVRLNETDFPDKTQYPLIDDPNQFKIAEENMDFLKNQYIKVETVVFDPKNNDKILLTAHY